MSRTRSFAAVILFLFGTTFLWLMPSFLSAGVSVSEAQWSVIQILVVITVSGYLAAAFGLWKAKQWWKPAAIGSALLGSAVLGLWWYAISTLTAVPNVGSSLAIHGVGSAIVLVVLLVPRLNHTLERRLLA